MLIARSSLNLVQYGQSGIPFSKLVMYHSLFLMFFHDHHDYGRAISLEPLLQVLPM